MKKILNLIIASIFTIFAPCLYASNFTLNSTSFLESTMLQPDYTCDGKNISPQLQWSNAPKGTASFALIVSDPDAPSGTFYHWVIFNIPKSTMNFNENETNLSAPIIVGKNSWEKNAYNGPCPPKGSKHNYIFSLFALDSTLDLSATASADDVLNAMKNHILGTTELKTNFGH